MNPRSNLKQCFHSLHMTVIIKLKTTGKTLKPYLAHVSKGGAAQEKFKRDYGIPMGACVKTNVKKGMKIGEIHDAVRKCAAELKIAKPQKTVKQANI